MLYKDKAAAIDRLERYYIKRLTRMTGLSFHVETKEVEEYMATGYYRRGEATATIVCDDDDYECDWADPKFTARTWEELCGVIDDAVSMARTMRIVERHGIEAFR